MDKTKIYVINGAICVKFTLTDIAEDEADKIIHDYVNKINTISSFFKASDIIYDKYPIEGTIRNVADYELGKIKLHKKQ